MPHNSYYNQPGGNSFVELNDFEKVLRGLPLEASRAALDLLETITRNVVQHPAEEKFRRVRTTNEKLAALFGTAGALDIMLEMGWQIDGDFVVLPKDVKLDFPKHIVKILEAKSHYDKLTAMKRGSAKLGRDPAKAGMLNQLELERNERSTGVTPTPIQPPSASAARAAPVAPEASPKPAPSPNPEVLPTTATAATAPNPGTDAPEVLFDAGWNCPTCTFGNRAELVACEMCETARPEKLAAESTVSTTPPESTAPSVISDSDPNPEATAFVDVPQPAQTAQPAANFQPPPRQTDTGKSAAPKKEMTLQELRAIQKNKFQDHKADPNSGQSDAYKRPPSTVGKTQEPGWFDWMWGGSSSSSGGGGGAPPKGPQQRQGPRIKGVADLPKPINRGGG